MVSSTNDGILPALQDGRARFLALVDEVRPQLHRYCARMVGSVAQGEDIVQDTLAHAYYELSELKELPAMRSWLFRIAHNRALDHLRSYERRMSEPLDDAFDVADDDALNPEDALAHNQALGVAVGRFLELPPAQRSCTILKDVLDHSLDEIAALLQLSVPAVKANLHRGRIRLRELSATPHATPQRPVSPALARYVALFNARDWDGVRAMLADDVKLDLVSREKRSGRQNVSHYFTNYAKVHDWHLAQGWLDGREVLAVFRNPGDTRPGYFIELTIANGQIAVIQDFRYVPYIGRDAMIELADDSPMG
jgi:RNA polymerase sigma factor (sigma-70 family)